MQASHSPRTRLSRLGVQASASALLTASLALAPIALATDGTWNVNAAGNWSTAGNWLSSTIADGQGATANLTFNITAARIVTIDTTSRTLGILNIGDTTTSSSSYTLAASGGASLIFDNGASNAQLNQNSTSFGDTISAPILLNSSLDIANSSATKTLTLSTGGITANTSGLKTITNQGGAAGAVTISGVIGNGSGTVAVTQNSTTSKLTLSGANTFSGGVNLAAGTLSLGNANALGTGTLTIGASTTLDSSAANLVNAGNNAMTWNGNFTFTGTNALDLGTGTVTLAAPLTVTTTANTLTVGGAISGGSIFDITKAGAGTLAYSNNIALDSNRTANVSAGVLSLSGVITGGNTITVNGPGTLSLSGANGSAAAATIAANSGSTLNFDSGTTSFAGSARAGNVTLKGANLTVNGNATANSNDTIAGALTADAPSAFGSSGANTVTVTPNAATNAQLTAASLARANNGAVFFRGTNLGANTIASATANTSNIVFTAAPTSQLVGGGGAAGSLNISIIPWAVGSSAASGAPTSFVTYDANGIRPLSSSEYDTTIPATASTNNVKLDGASPVIANGATTINSLFLTNAASSVTVLSGTGALTVTSGAIYADFSLGGNSNALTISKQIDFGTAEGVIGTMVTANSKTLAFSGGITGSGGITIYDANSGANPSTQAGVSINAATTYTGNTIINGALIAANPNALPNFANGSRTGDVYVNGTLGLSGSTNSTIRINGLYGSGRIITPFSNNETLIVGDNNATSTFDGTITQGSGAISITKVGTGVLTLTGTGNNWTGATAIQNGTLSVVTLNNIATPNATSSLGKPTTITNGTIALGTSSTGTGTLKVVGTGETTDRVINLAGTTGGGAIDQSGTGLLKFTTDFTATGAGSKTLTLLGSSAGTGEIAGAIINNSVTNKTSVAKTGTGTWTLSGANTYTGTTTVSQGTLALGAADRIADTSNLVMAGGTFATGGFSETLGTLTLSAGSTIDLGAGVSALVFADSSAATWGSSIGLSFVNFDAGVDSIRIGTTSAGVTGTQLSQITINGFAASIDASGFLSISAVPEPSSFAFLAGAGALLATGFRRKPRQTTAA